MRRGRFIIWIRNPNNKHNSPYFLHLYIKAVHGNGKGKIPLIRVLTSHQGFFSLLSSSSCWSMYALHFPHTIFRSIFFFLYVSAFFLNRVSSSCRDKFLFVSESIALIFYSQIRISSLPCFQSINFLSLSFVFYVYLFRFRKNLSLSRFRGDYRCWELLLECEL